MKIKKRGVPARPGMSNRNLLIIGVFLLLAVFTILVVQMNRESSRQSLGGSINEVVDEVRDEIDDQTGD